VAERVSQSLAVDDLGGRVARWNWRGSGVDTSSIWHRVGLRWHLRGDWRAHGRGDWSRVHWSRRLAVGRRNIALHRLAGRNVTSWHVC